jgi:hypothetical protein
MKRSEAGQNLVAGKGRPLRWVQLAHLVDNHSERIAVRLAGWWTVLIEQEFRTHPANRPRRRNVSCGQWNCAEVNHDPHKTKVRDASRPVVVDENVRLLRWSVGKKKMGRERSTVPL